MKKNFLFLITCCLFFRCFCPEVKATLLHDLLSQKPKNKDEVGVWEKKIAFDICINPNSLEPGTFNNPNENGQTPLQVAIEDNLTAIAQMLIRNPDVNIYTLDHNGNSPLHLACNFHNLAIVEELLRRHRNNLSKFSNQSAIEILSPPTPNYIDEQNNNRQTPLHVATYNGHTETVLWLINHSHKNANIYTRDLEEHTPLQVACKLKRLSIVKALLERHEKNLIALDDISINFETFDQFNKDLKILIAESGKEENSTETLRNIISILREKISYFNFLIQNSQDTMALHTAITNGHFSTASALIHHPNINIYATDAKGRTALHTACMTQRLDLKQRITVVNLLLIRHIQNCEQTRGNSLITNNSASERLSYTESEINGINEYLSIKDAEGHTALHLAVKYQNWPIIDFFRSIGANIWILDSSSRSILYWVGAWMGIAQNPASLSLLISNSSIELLNERTLTGDTILHIAARKHLNEAIDQLISRGVNLEQNYQAETALHIISENYDFLDEDKIEDFITISSSSLKKNEESRSNLKLFSRLLEKTEASRLNLKNKIGNTILHIVTQRGYLNLVNALITYQADINVQNTQLNTPLHIATERVDIDIFNTLANSPMIELDLQNVSEETPLHIATRAGNLEMVKTLISNGASLNLKNKKGETLLHIAIQRRNDIQNDLQKKRLISKNRTSLNLRNGIHETHPHVGTTPLAYYQNDLQSNSKKADIVIEDKIKELNQFFEIIKLLVEKDEINLNLENASGDTALHVATRTGDVEVISLLLKHNVRLDLQNLFGETVLHIATLQNNSDLAGMFIARINNVDTQDNTGDTALHIAALQGNAKIFRLLLDKGANLNLRNGQGETTLFLAVENGHEEVVKTILDSGKFKISQLLPLEKDILLCTATTQKQLGILQSLLNIGLTQLNTAYKDYTLLHRAIFDSSNPNQFQESHTRYVISQNCNAKIIEMLLSQGANPNLITSMHGPILHNLFDNLHENDLYRREMAFALIKILLNNKGNVSTEDAQGNTPLHITLQNLNLFTNGSRQHLFQAIDVLLNKNINILHRNKNKKTALELAIENLLLTKDEQRKCILTVIRSLLNELSLKKANFNLSQLSDSQQETLLRFTIHGGDSEFLKLLFEAGLISLDSVQIEPYTPLHTAIFDRPIPILDLSLENNLSSHVPRPLINRNCNIRVIETLLDAGANPNLITETQRPILHSLFDNLRENDLQRRERAFNLIKILFKNEENTNIEDNQGNTPLHVLIQNSNSFTQESRQYAFRAINLLLNNDVNRDSQDQGEKKLFLYHQNHNGETPLELALSLAIENLNSSNNEQQENILNIIKILIEKMQRPSLGDVKKVTPLQAALEYIIKNLNFPNSYGNKYAFELASLLLEAGADPDVIISEAYTALEIIISKLNLLSSSAYESVLKTIKLLLKYEAKLTLTNAQRRNMLLFLTKSLLESQSDTNSERKNFVAQIIQILLENNFTFEDEEGNFPPIELQNQVRDLAFYCAIVDQNRSIYQTLSRRISSPQQANPISSIRGVNRSSTLRLTSRNENRAQSLGNIPSNVRTNPGTSNRLSFNLDFPLSLPGASSTRLSGSLSSPPNRSSLSQLIERNSSRQNNTDSASSISSNSNSPPNSINEKLDEVSQLGEISFEIYDHLNISGKDNNESILQLLIKNLREFKGKKENRAIELVHHLLTLTRKTITNSENNTLSLIGIAISQLHNNEKYILEIINLLLEEDIFLTEMDKKQPTFQQLLLLREMPSEKELVRLYYRISQNLKNRMSGIRPSSPQSRFANSTNSSSPSSSSRIQEQRSFSWSDTFISLFLGDSPGKSSR